MNCIEEFLARLPNGLDSYPECQMKASFLHEKFIDPPYPIDRSILPQRLLNYLDNPPPSSMWVPSVDMFALNHALVEAFNDEKKFREYTVEINRAKLTSPMYRALFMFISPKTLVNKAQSRWTKVHQGITMTARMTGEDTFEGEIHYPEHLATPILVEIWADILGLALGLAGAKGVRNTMTDYSPTCGRYAGCWE